MPIDPDIIITRPLMARQPQQHLIIILISQVVGIPIRAIFIYVIELSFWFFRFEYL